jgi:hypothetical protein
MTFCKEPEEVGAVFLLKIQCRKNVASPDFSQIWHKLLYNCHYSRLFLNVFQNSLSTTRRCSRKGVGAGALLGGAETLQN